MVALSLTRVWEEVKKVVRRLDQLQKTVDLLYAERDLLEQIQGRLLGIEEQLKLNRQHGNQVRKDIKEEIRTVQDKVEDKVEEIGDQLDKKDIIKLEKRRWWEILRRR